MARRDNQFLREKVVFLFPHASTTATVTHKIFKAKRAFIVDAIRYINPTGLAGDGTNAFAGDVKNGSTVVATVFNTDTGDAGGASLAADTFVDGVIDAAAATLAAGDILSLVLTEDGTATLPAGLLQVEGRYL